MWLQICLLHKSTRYLRVMHGKGVASISSWYGIIGARWYDLVSTWIYDILTFTTEVSIYDAYPSLRWEIERSTFHRYPGGQRRWYYSKDIIHQNLIGNPLIFNWLLSQENVHVSAKLRHAQMEKRSEGEEEGGELEERWKFDKHTLILLDISNQHLQYPGMQCASLSS